MGDVVAVTIDAKRANPERFRNDETVLEQYKTYVADLGRIGSRHSDASKFFVSLLSALVVFQSLAGKIGGANDLVARILRAGVPVAGVILCILWMLTVDSYSRLYLAKIGIIKVLESKLSYPCFDEEYQLLGGQEYRPIARGEKYIAWTLIVFFAVVAVVGFSAA